jgi:hypothetical protein
LIKTPLSMDTVYNHYYSGNITVNNYYAAAPPARNWFKKLADKFSKFASRLTIAVILSFIPATYPVKNPFRHSKEPPYVTAPFKTVPKTD